MGLENAITFYIDKYETLGKMARIRGKNLLSSLLKNYFLWRNRENFGYSSSFIKHIYALNSITFGGLLIHCFSVESLSEC